jgi:hypothetical protein
MDEGPDGEPCLERIPCGCIVSQVSSGSLHYVVTAAPTSVEMTKGESVLKHERQHSRGRLCHTCIAVSEHPLEDEADLRAESVATGASPGSNEKWLSSGLERSDELKDYYHRRGSA